MDEEQDYLLKTWSHQFQGTSYGDAVDRAIDYWRKNVISKHLVPALAARVDPDEIIAVGAFPITMRPEAVNKYNNMDGVWDITIRWC